MEEGGQEGKARGRRGGERMEGEVNLKIEGDRMWYQQRRCGCSGIAPCTLT